MKSKPWSQKEIEILKQYYGKIKKQKLQLLLNRTPRSIAWKAYDLCLIADRSITNRTHNVDHNYFSVLNIENCYWAGFLAADGNISNNKVLRFCQKEKEVLENFKKCIKHEGIIYKHPNRSVYDIFINSQQICKDLHNNFSITSKKSLTLKPPNLVGDFALSYIIGYLDGDGHISIVKEKRYNSTYLSFGILGTLELTTWIKNIINLGGFILKRTDCKNPIYKFTASHLSARKILYKLLGVNGIEFKLHRKWNKVIEWRKTYET